MTGIVWKGEPMTCPTCHQPADRSKSILKGQTVFRCGPCNLFAVKDGARWIPGGPGVVAGLRTLIEIRDEEAERFRQMMESDIDDDPRWTRLW